MSRPAVGSSAPHAVDHQKAVELADRRNPPRQAARRQLRRRGGGEIGVQAWLVGGFERRRAGCREKPRKIAKVVAIGGERQPRGAALGREHFEKRLEMPRKAGRRTAAPPGPALGSLREARIRQRPSRPAPTAPAGSTRRERPPRRARPIRRSTTTPMVSFPMPRLACPLAGCFRPNSPGRTGLPIDDPAARYASTLSGMPRKRAAPAERIGVETDAARNGTASLGDAALCPVPDDRPRRADGRRQDQDRPPPRDAARVCRSSIRIRRSRPPPARPIEEIFANRGERVFRDGERRVIARLLAKPVHVLATGGGAFMDPATRAVDRGGAACRSGCAPISTCWCSGCRAAADRPLLKAGDPRGDPGRADRAALPDLCRGRS